MKEEWPRAKNVELPPKGFDAPSSLHPQVENPLTLEESIGLAIEAAKVGQVYGAQQVISNLRKKYGPSLIPPEIGFSQSLLPPDAFPFTLALHDGSPLLDDGEIDANDQIILENFGTFAQWGKQWIRYMALNCASIEEDTRRLGDFLQAHTFDISSVKDPRLAVVCGSGASLEETKTFLKDFPGLILCGASNASTVCQAGRIPHAILAIDSGEATIDHLKEVPFDEFGSTLVTATSIHPDVPKLFPRNRRWFTSIVQMEKGANHPFNVFSYLLYPQVKSVMFQAGCAINAEVLFLNLLSEMQNISFDAVFLLGCDFCYKKDAYRCNAYKYEKKRYALIPPYRGDIPVPCFRSFNGEVTDEVFLGYKRSLLTAWVITKLPLYDCSNGILTEVPRADFRSLAEGGFAGRPPSYEYAETIRAYNEYLKRIGYKGGADPGFEGTQIQGELWPGT